MCELKERKPDALAEGSRPRLSEIKGCAFFLLFTDDSVSGISEEGTELLPAFSHTEVVNYGKLTVLPRK